MMNDKQEAVTNLSIEAFSALLDNAIIGQLCVQIWLGHGDALFLGLGKEVSPPPTPRLSPAGRSYLRHYQPAYEIQTYSSDWTLRDGATILATSFDDPKAKVTSTRLVGSKATEWRFLHPSWGLSVAFSDGWLLEILPYKNYVDSNSDAWGLRGPDGFYSIVRLSGECYIVQGNKPVTP